MKVLSPVKKRIRVFAEGLSGIFIVRLVTSGGTVVNRQVATVD